MKTHASPATPSVALEREGWRDQLVAAISGATGPTLSKLNELLELLTLAETSTDLEFVAREFVWLQQPARRPKPAGAIPAVVQARRSILTIRASAGGKEAKSWALILARMYMRWLKLHGINGECLDWDESEPGLLKEAAFLVDLAAGELASEAGVHRLTRFSPFCSENKLQTSFAIVTIEPEPVRVKFTLPMHEVRIDVYRAQGPGGQGVNTTDSAVRAVHVPTGTVATCQMTRSQIKNRESALQILQQRVEVAMLSPRETRRAGTGWGEAIRSYVLNGKARVKDHRSGAEESRPLHVLEGHLDRFLQPLAFPPLA